MFGKIFCGAVAGAVTTALGLKAKDSLVRAAMKDQITIPSSLETHIYEGLFREAGELMEAEAYSEMKMLQKSALFNSLSLFTPYAQAAKSRGYLDTNHDEFAQLLEMSKVSEDFTAPMILELDEKVREFVKAYYDYVVTGDVQFYHVYTHAFLEVIPWFKDHFMTDVRQFKLDKDFKQFENFINGNVNFSMLIKPILKGVMDANPKEGDVRYDDVEEIGFAHTLASCVYLSVYKKMTGASSFADAEDAISKTLYSIDCAEGKDAFLMVLYIWTSLCVFSMYYIDKNHEELAKAFPEKPEEKQRATLEDLKDQLESLEKKRIEQVEKRTRYIVSTTLGLLVTAIKKALAEENAK